MPLSPEEFYSHAVAAADAEQRLPLSRMTGWDISPFEADGLRVSRLRPPVVPEPPRHGEDPADCESCQRRDEGIWLDDRWRLTQILGVLHVWFFARPEGQAQLFGSWLVVWDDLLPEYPAALARTDAATVADALVASYGGRRGPLAS
jgi:hypothetical protein